MSDNTTSTEASTTTPAEAGRPSETPEQTIAALREALAKANGEAKEHRLKANELDKLKAAQMSDLERANAERDQVRQELQAEKAAALRWRIAATHGIADDDAETFLTGADEATLTKQASRLVEMRSQLAAAGTNTPKPDLTQGGSGTAPLALNGDGLEAALRAKLNIA